MPLQANATVTRLDRSSGPAGVTEAGDWDVDTGDAPVAPATEAAAKWAGTVRAYYRETGDRLEGDGEVNILVRRELRLDTADVDRLELDTNDVITFTVDGETETTGVAKAIRRSKLNGVRTGIQTSLVVLEAG